MMNQLRKSANFRYSTVYVQSNSDMVDEKESLMKMLTHFPANFFFVSLALAAQRLQLVPCV